MPLIGTHPSLDFIQSAEEAIGGSCRRVICSHLHLENRLYKSKGITRI
jgi:hypothetical protein